MDSLFDMYGNFEIDLTDFVSDVVAGQFKMSLEACTAVKAAGPSQKGEERKVKEEVGVEGEVEKENQENGRKASKEEVPAGSWYPMDSPLEALTKLKLSEVRDRDKKVERERKKRKKRISDRLARSRF